MWMETRKNNKLKLPQLARFWGWVGTRPSMAGQEGTSLTRPLLQLHYDMHLQKSTKKKLEPELCPSNE